MKTYRNGFFSRGKAKTKKKKERISMLSLLSKHLFASVRFLDYYFALIRFLVLVLGIFFSNKFSVSIFRMNKENHSTELNYTVIYQ